MINGDLYKNIEIRFARAIQALIMILLMMSVNVKKN